MSRRSDPCAFTLVEVLAALALTGVVCALTGRIAVHLLHVRVEAGRIVHNLEREATIWDCIENDLGNLLQGVSGAEYPLRLYGAPEQTVELVTLAPSSTTGSLHLARYPATVRYRLVRDAEQRFDLVRQVADRTGPGQYRDTIASELSDFQVQVLIKDQWTEAYPGTNKALVARAIRFTCSSPDGSTTTRTFPIGGGT